MKPKTVLIWNYLNLHQPTVFSQHVESLIHKFPCTKSCTKCNMQNVSYKHMSCNLSPHPSHTATFTITQFRPHARIIILLVKCTSTTTMVIHRPLILHFNKPSRKWKTNLSMWLKIHPSIHYSSIDWFGGAVESDRIVGACSRRCVLFDERTQS